MAQIGVIPDSWRKLGQPDKRIELVSLLSELSNKQSQERLWIRHEDYPNSYGIDEVFHFFFDDTDLADNPKSTIGSVLLDEKEASEIERLSILLSQMLDRLGDVGSEQYICDDVWPLVMSQAGSVLRRLQGAGHS